MIAESSEIAADVLIVGAGFAGLNLLYKLREAGFSAIILEAGADVGGTWYWNRYPGARCDVQSTEYQLSFPDSLQRGWDWSEKYATQPEIERYLRYVANKLDLRKHIRFNERVTAAYFRENTSDWEVRSDSGRVACARFCVMATGCLSVSQTPAIEGLDSFPGEIFHTGNWPVEQVSFAGKRVAVIGTGSSGVQAIPEIAGQAEHLFVLQRTPNFVLPAHNRPLTPDHVSASKENHATQRQAVLDSPTYSAFLLNPRKARDMTKAEREAEYEARWASGSGFDYLGASVDLLIDREANDYAADYARRQIAEIVGKPELVEKLTPRGYPIGTKRITLGTDYYETFLRSNVTLVDVRAQPISRVGPTGIECGEDIFDVDAIVLATGFDAVTGALSKIDIQGPAGALAAKWADGPRTFLGLATAGFPNLFFITGPGSPSVLTNVVVAVEEDINWIMNCLDYMRERSISQIEATVPAEDTWVQHVQDVAAATLYPQANSWYMGANIPGKPRLFLPYVGGANAYRAKCWTVAANNFDGFVLSSGGCVG